MSTPGRSVETVSDAAVRLMEAAADAFAAKGFHATTTRDIASHAGLSPAGVYVHFASKEDLLFQLSREGHEAARDMLVAAASAAGSPTEALRSIMAVFSQWHAEHFRVARIVQYEFQNLTAEHREAVLGLRKEIDSVVRDVLTAGVTSGEFTVTDVPDTALALLSMAVDVARWYDPEIKRTPEAIGRTYGELGLRLVT
ncbi:TetR/AcrR family transcriptional regulator [Phycicoccus sp. SLBN-51]|uniref:TetR/AcrR family transcriptional regulator n=1 Tax=Phycicoccus sp. SLBN-51 TaxID=2768447 RepID=UPI00114F47E2|nr:TetR/AcrR family transcriptional regulator [Phycicoccus sp. SLBN-51]TQJ51474.1 TetR family transcriptional regulator [Phycicoccus sp. SLBN-51]